jgi:hypothetical protein
MSFVQGNSSALRTTSKLEDQVSVFMSPRDRVVKLYSEAPSSLFIALQHSQNDSGGIVTRHHEGENKGQLPKPIPRLGVIQPHQTIRTGSHGGTSTILLCTITLHLEMYRKSYLLKN